MAFILLLAAPAQAVDAGRELAAAADLAERGRGRAAIAAYDALLESGVDFPGLRYNLGTLYLEESDVGRAVLHLRACLREQPRHDDARFNFARAEAARADRVDDTGRRRLWQVLAETQSSEEAAWALLLVSALCVLLLIAAGWTRGRTRRGVLSALLVGLVLWTLAAGAVWSRAIADDLVEAVVVQAEVAARKGPSADAASTFLAHPGLYGEVRAEENGFVRLRLSSGLDAWLPAEALAFIGPRTQPRP